MSQYDARPGELAHFSPRLLSRTLAQKLSAQLTAEQITEFKQAFRNFDADNDGYYTALDLGRVQREQGLNPSEAELKLIISEADIDGNGVIDLHEFIVLTAGQLLGADKKNRLREAFGVFDRNGNGVIDSEEVKLTMQSLGERLTDEQVGEMIKEADLNGDGVIDYEEFVRMIPVKVK